MVCLTVLMRDEIRVTGELSFRDIGRVNDVAVLENLDFQYNEFENICQDSTMSIDDI